MSGFPRTCHGRCCISRVQAVGEGRTACRAVFAPCMHRTSHICAGSRATYCQRTTYLCCLLIAADISCCCSSVQCSETSEKPTVFNFWQKVFLAQAVSSFVTFKGSVMCVQVFPTSALFHSTLMTCHSVHRYKFAGLGSFLFTAVMVLAKAPLSLLCFLSLLLWYFNFVSVSLSVSLFYQQRQVVF